MDSRTPSAIRRILGWIDTILKIVGLSGVPDDLANWKKSVLAVAAMIIPTGFGLSAIFDWVFNLDIIIVRALNVLGVLSGVAFAIMVILWRKRTAVPNRGEPLIASPRIDITPQITKGQKQIDVFLNVRNTLFPVVARGAISLYLEREKMPIAPYPIDWSGQCRTRNETPEPQYLDDGQVVQVKIAEIKGNQLSDKPWEFSLKLCNTSLADIYRQTTATVDLEVYSDIGLLFKGQYALEVDSFSSIRFDGSGQAVTPSTPHTSTSPTPPTS